MDGNVPKRLMDVAECASYLGRSEGAVRGLIWKGRLPVVKLDGRVQIDKKDLDDLIEKSKFRETIF